MRYAKQRRQPLVHESSLERIEEQVPPVARLHPLDQQLVLGRDARPLPLHLEQRPQRLHLGAAIDAAAASPSRSRSSRGEFARQRQSASRPARNRAFAVRRATHPRRHVAHAHELERRAGEDEAVAGLEARDERLLDRAEALCRAGYCTPICASPTIVPIDMRCRRAISASSTTYRSPHERDARVLGIRAQRLAAVLEKLEHPRPLGVSQLARRRVSCAPRPAARPARSRRRARR